MQADNHAFWSQLFKEVLNFFRNRSIRGALRLPVSPFFIIEEVGVEPTQLSVALPLSYTQ